MKFKYRKVNKNDIKQISSLVTDLLGTCNLDANDSIENNNISEITSAIDKYMVCEINNAICGLSDVKKKSIIMD